MSIKAFLKSVFYFFTVTLLVSCDSEFNQIGADLIDDIHYQFESYDAATVVAYNQPTGEVQTNNLPINSLGYYSNGIFGKTTASFVTQLELANVNPKFYGVSSPNFTVDSVYIHIPYFAKIESANADGSIIFNKLDSIQGLDSNNNAVNKIKLSLYESGYFLRNLDPQSQLQEAQAFYSNQRADIEAVTNMTSRLNNSDVASQNDLFEFKKTQTIFYKRDTNGNLTTEVRERLAPGVYMDLNKDFFKNKIFNAPTGSLENNDIFKTYLKGLYFKVEEVAGQTQGTMARLNFSLGKIVIVYKGMDKETDDPNVSANFKRKSISLNLRGNTVNFLENQNYNPTQGNVSVGDDRLNLKGGVGNMAVIKLFSGNEISQLKSNNWLINEASLVFNIDESAMGNLEKSKRIYLYDLKNKRPLLDYFVDLSSNALDPKKNKFVHDGILNNNKYKIRITNHIRNIIKNDSTNVNLGLVVTETINLANNVKLKNSFTTSGTEVKLIPAMSVVNPLGTILFGTNIPVSDPNYGKRIKLEIFYTKPD